LDVTTILALFHASLFGLKEEAQIVFTIISKGCGKKAKIKAFQKFGEF